MIRMSLYPIRIAVVPGFPQTTSVSNEQAKRLPLASGDFSCAGGDAGEESHAGA